VEYASAVKYTALWDILRRLMLCKHCSG